MAAVATSGSHPRKKSSEAGTPSPVKILRKKIQGFAFNTEVIGGVAMSTRDTSNSKEGELPVRKSKQIFLSSTIQLRKPPERRVIASIEILDDGSVIDLPTNTI